MSTSDHIIEVLNWLSEKLGIAIDWSSKSILPQIEEAIAKYATFKTVVCAIGTAIGLGLIITSVSVLCRFIKQQSLMRMGLIEYCLFWVDEDSPSAAGCAALVMSIILLLAGIILFPIALSNMLGWALAPEMKVIEMLSDFIKSN